MKRRLRVRRTFLLCSHFLRNFAFYRAGRCRGQLIRKNQFWVTVSNNCLDICVLEWCKLYADAKGKHHWKKIVDDQAAFECQLLQCLCMTHAQYNDYIIEMRTYRDRFVAHLDEDETMIIPVLRPARRSVALLYSHIQNVESECFSEPIKIAA